MAAQNLKHQITRSLYDITQIQWKYPITKLSHISEGEGDLPAECKGI